MNEEQLNKLVELKEAFSDARQRYDMAKDTLDRYRFRLGSEHMCSFRIDLAEVDPEIEG
jgi:hypothetical protein